MANNNLETQIDNKTQESQKQISEKPLEDIIVYESLKNTALHCEDGVRNAKIYMYVVYFTLLTIYFALPLSNNYSHWLLLLSFLILITFQTMINSDRIAIERISSYIRVFFETKRDNMHWSLLNKDEDHLTFYNATYQNIGWIINYWGASLLALVSIVIMFYQILSEYSICEWTIYTVIEIIIGCGLFYLVFYINKCSYINNEKHKETIARLDESIEKFYKKYY